MPLKIESVDSGSLYSSKINYKNTGREQFQLRELASLLPVITTVFFEPKVPTREVSPNLLDHFLLWFFFFLDSEGQVLPFC